MDIYIATEDELSEVVAERLVAESNPRLQVAVRMGRKGFGYLKQRLVELNDTASSIPVLLLTDLDRAACPPGLINEWRGNRILSTGMMFRVAVREVEAWLLADREGFARFSGAPVGKVPSAPETLNDPKAEILNLVRRYGGRGLKADMLPALGARVGMGLGYNQALSCFVRESWSVDRASVHAASLERARIRLRNFDVNGFSGLVV